METPRLHGGRLRCSSYQLRYFCLRLPAISELLGAPKDVLPLCSDDSYQFVRTIRDSKVSSEDGFLDFRMKTQHEFLFGTNAMILVDRYMEIFSRNLSKNISIEVEWVDLHDFFCLSKSQLFLLVLRLRSALSYFSVYSTITEDFWAFDRNILTLFKATPPWLCPEAYKSRENMLQNDQKSTIHLQTNVPIFPRRKVNDPGWDTYFGSKYIKARQHFNSWNRANKCRQSRIWRSRIIIWVSVIHRISTTTLNTHTGHYKALHKFHPSYILGPFLKVFC